MTDIQSGAALPNVYLDDSLLAAKLSVPALRPGFVSRVALIEKARSSDCRVVAITAPAGYGKSTLLAEWAHAEDRRVLWVSLDRLDDDPSALISLFASAYVKALSTSPELMSDVSGPGMSVLGRAAPRIASAFRTSPQRFVMMIDDLDALQSPDCHYTLSLVIAGIPPGSQLVGASRSEQPHLPQLRTTGDVLEILFDDLALDATGAQQIFAQTGVGITHEQAVSVTESTEGWPAGLHLAAMIARDSRDDTLAVSGDDRYVADYLYRESLLHLPESTQRFLRRTAVLDQLSAPLCDALLDDNNSQGELRALEASNVFLVALDRRREWYRYHALFRDFLLGLLRQTEPDLIMELHVRAAHWYESNGSPASALEHLLDTGERERCVRLVTELSMPTYQAGQISTVMRWLRALGDPAIESYPPLGVIAGWAAALSGSSAEAQKWAHFIDTAEWDAVPADGSASFASARSMLRAIMCASGPEQAITDGDFAVAAEPPWSPWRGTALAVAGEAHLLAGDVDKAAALFGESSAVAAVDLNADNLVVSESELGLLAMDRGRWSEAADHVDLALATIDARRMHDYGVCLLAFAAAARLSVHRGDISEATRRLTQAMRARPSCTYAIPGLAVRLRLQLAQVYLALADRTTARHLVREIDDILLQRPALGALVEQVAHFRQVLAASAHLGATGGSPLSPAELRLLPYLQTHLTIGEIAGQLYVSRNTASSEVSSIYRKLGVSSRKDAVEQATMLGLLGV